MLSSFIVATALITLMPGPSLLIILLGTIDHGLAYGLRTTLGVVVADATLLLLVLSGLGAVLYASPLVFTVLKWAGAAYLVYLGAMLLVRAPVSNEGPARQTGGAFSIGYGTTILNPKIIGFLLVYFPQFLDRRTAIAPQMLILGPLFLFVVFLVFSACALLARPMRRLLASDQGRRLVRHGSGLSLLACGLYAAFTS
jgi:threonine/homoserine/homoserine lactone efflux protein